MAVAARLQERHGLYLNGLILLSCALQLQTLLFDEGNDLPYPLILPAFAQTAIYHGRVQAPDDLAAFVAEVEDFAVRVYTPALMRGTDLAAEEAEQIAGTIGRYTGLDPAFVLRCNNRVSLPRFCRELLRTDRRTVGRLDSRFVGRAPDAAGELLERDPAMSALMGPYASAFLHDLRARLRYDNDEVYAVLSREVNQAWRFPEPNRYLDVTGHLRTAMLDNPHLQVFAASGTYDLATPAFATDYTLSHLGLDPDRLAAIRHRRYEAGHMMYIHDPSMEALRADLLTFFAETR